MTWNAPFTAVDGTPFTAAQYNTNIRDNLVETEVGKAQTAGGYCVTTGSNQITERVADSSILSTIDTTQSTSYTDLDTTTGPSVTVTTGEAAFVAVYGSIQNSSSVASWIGYSVSGASSIDPLDSRAVEIQANSGQRMGAVWFIDGLTPGLNTFTCKYRVSTTGTGSFAFRRIAVFPF